MDIIVLITSCIIILLIIFCSWNIVYENYTAVSSRNLLLLDSNNNLSKYLVRDFTDPIDNDIREMTNTLNTIDGKLTDYTIHNLISPLETRVNRLFPDENTKLTLYTIPTTAKPVAVARDMTYYTLGILTGEQPFTIKTVAGNRYYYFRTSNSIFQSSTTIRPDFSGNFILEMTDS